MEHSFDINLASEVGIEEAIIFKHLVYWILKNYANDKNYHDGEYWTYNSANAFREIFFYMSPNKVRTALEKLEAFGYIKTGNYNTSAYDRTKWYTLAEKGKSICGKSNIHLWNSANGIEENSKPIPDNNTQINNTDSNTNNILHSEECESAKIDKFFNEIWKLYPKKKGKGQVSFAKKKKLYNLGYETVSKCIDRFVAEFKLSGKDEQFMMHGSTFFNSGYVDFLDENYNQTTITEEPVKESEPEEPINMFDVDDETYFRMRHGDAL